MLIKICPEISEEEVILFSREMELNEEGFLNHFSCPSPNKRGLSGRVVVTYQGRDEGAGHWKCQKDSGSCSHLGSCRQKFQQLVQGTPNVQGVQPTPDFFEDPGVNYIVLF